MAKKRESNLIWRIGTIDDYVSHTYCSRCANKPFLNALRVWLPCIPTKDQCEACGRHYTVTDTVKG